MNILHRRIARIGFVLGYGTTIGVMFAFPHLLDLATSHERRFAIGAVLVISIVSAVICLTAWRCHDFGKSAWDNFWTEQVPFIGGIWALFELLFIPGDKARNGYGDPPAI